MKKIAVVLFFILLFGFVCYAEDLDFSSFSDDEILEIYDKIQFEIGRRLLQEHKVRYSGYYVAGDDIEPGAYLLQGLKDGYNMYALCEDDSIKHGDSSKIFFSSYVCLSEISRIKLEEGQTLWIGSDSVVAMYNEP